MTPRLAKAIINGLMVALAVLSLAPLLWMASVSFMQPGEAAHFPPPLLPSAPTLHNYHELFARAGMGRYLLNSVLIASLTTAIGLLLNTLAGYAFAKLQFKGRERTFRALLAALVIPAQVAMMPLFLLLKQMGLVNTYFGAMVPGLAGIFGIFLVRQYARSLPDELLEAARIDGATWWRQLLHVTLPMLGPVLLLVSILTMAGYFQLFAEPYVITQGGPLQSTVSVLYMMYDEGFKWWNLGNASAVAFLLFLLMTATTSGLLWFARKRGVE